eukprot:657248-Hanusia_phi.AAC.1
MDSSQPSAARCWSRKPSRSVFPASRRHQRTNLMSPPTLSQSSSLPTGSRQVYPAPEDNSERTTAS